jgi:hypothetical protein
LDLEDYEQQRKFELMERLQEHDHQLKKRATEMAKELPLPPTSFGPGRKIPSKLPPRDQYEEPREEDLALGDEYEEPREEDLG